MKKLVSMLLIVGIIASLFTCMTVSADDTTVTGNAPAYMLDFSVKGSAEAATNTSKNGTPTRQASMNGTPHTVEQVLALTPGTMVTKNMRRQCLNLMV